MGGHPVGSAMEPFNQRYSQMGAELGEELRLARHRTPDPLDIADIWIASSDARNYVVLGDPEVRLAVEDGASDA